MSMSTTLMMLLDASLRCVLVFGLAGVVCLLLRNRPAAVRHGVWTTAVILALLLPALSAVLPSWRLGVLPDVVALTTSSEPLSEQPIAAPSFDQDPAPRATAPAAALPQAEIAADETMAEVDSVASVESSPAEPQPQPQTSMATLRDVSVSTWVLLIWSAGVVVMFISMLTGTIAIRRTARKSSHITDAAILSMKDRLCEELAIHSPVLMLQSDESFVPVTWGVWWPTVLLPREAKDWTTQRLRMVLLHELAHIKRGDCMTQLLVQLTRAIYWFHPLVWWAGRNLRIQREHACDDLVLSAGIAGAEYADQLLQIVRSLRSGSGTPLAAVAMARKSQFESRLLSVLDTDRQRGGLSRKLAWAILAASLAVALPIAALQPVARAQKAAENMEASASIEHEDAPKENLQKSRDNVIVEDLAIEILAAIRDENDEKLQAMSFDYKKGWIAAWPHFALELREKYRQFYGKPFNMNVADSMVSGDIAAVRCDVRGKKNESYLVLFFMKTGEGWKNCMMQNSPPARTLDENMKHAERMFAPQQNPCVVKTTPAALADDVDARLSKITVTFDQPMMDGSWSWTGGGETYPKTTGKIYYDQAKKTCTLPVKLEPGKVYWVGINSPSHQNFKTAARIPAKRYVILFATKTANGKPTPIPQDMLQRAKQINGVSQLPSQSLARMAIPDAVLYHVTGAFLQVAMPYWQQNKFANAQIYLLTDENQLIFAGMLPVYNSTSKPWVADVERKLTNSSYNDMLVFNTQNPEDAKPDCQWVKNRTGHGGRYSLMWKPKYPLNPGDSKLFLLQRPVAEPLPEQNGNVQIRMQNHYGVAGVEQFYLAVPVGREVKNVSRKWTSKSSVDGYDVYCFQTEVTPETNNVVTAEIGKTAVLASPTATAESLAKDFLAAMGREDMDSVEALLSEDFKESKKQELLPLAKGMDFTKAKIFGVRRDGDTVRIAAYPISVHQTGSRFYYCLTLVRQTAKQDAWSICDADFMEDKEDAERFVSEKKDADVKAKGSSEKEIASIHSAWEAAGLWLQMVDEGKYENSWDELAATMRAVVTKDQWIQQITPLRENLGPVKSRKLISSHYTATMPGGPDGEYVVIQYQTVFENKKCADETVTPMKDKDGTWRVSGYYVK